MATRKYMNNQIKHIPKHKKAPLMKNCKGFNYKRLDLVREGYDMPSKHLAAK